MINGVSSKNYPYKYDCFKDSKDDLVGEVEYRDYKVLIYMDDYGQQYYCKIDNEEIGFGAYNTWWLEDLLSIIDNKLDVYYRFENEYFGARLEWFENDAFRDLGLYYRNRLIKVFTKEEVNEDTIIEISKFILNNYIKE